MSCIAAEGKPVTTPEYPMGLPSVVPSAETAKSEAERQEREALADMFSPSSPHGDQHHHAVPGPSGVNEAESRAAAGEGAMEDGPVFEEKRDGDKGNDMRFSFFRDHFNLLSAILFRLSEGLCTKSNDPDIYDSFSVLLPHILRIQQTMRGEWPSGLNSFRQVTEVKLGRVTSNSGWVTSEA